MARGGMTRVLLAALCLAVTLAVGDARDSKRIVQGGASEELRFKFTLTECTAGDVMTGLGIDFENVWAEFQFRAAGYQTRYPTAHMHKFGERSVTSTFADVGVEFPLHSPETYSGTEQHGQVLLFHKVKDAQGKWERKAWGKFKGIERASNLIVQAGFTWYPNAPISWKQREFIFRDGRSADVYATCLGDMVFSGPGALNTKDDYPRLVFKIPPVHLHSRYLPSIHRMLITHPWDQDWEGPWLPGRTKKDVVIDFGPRTPLIEKQFRDNKFYVNWWGSDERWGSATPNIHAQPFLADPKDKIVKTKLYFHLHKGGMFYNEDDERTKKNGAVELPVWYYWWYTTGVRNKDYK